MAILYPRKSGRIPTLILVSGGILFLSAIAFFSLPSKTNVLPQNTPGLKGLHELSLSATRLEPGDTLVVKVAGKLASTAPSAVFNRNLLSFFRWQDDWLAIAGIDVYSAAGTKVLLVKLPSGAILERPIIIGQRPLAITELKLPAELIRQGVSPEVLRTRIVSGDNQRLAAVFAKFSPKIEFSQTFLQPLGQWLDVGGFGVIRKSGNAELRHLGVDLEGETGDSVAAANDGMVTFSGQLENFGTSVVVDHGLGIFTAYLHLDKAVVRVGDEVLRGQILGAVGSSGEYVLAPHLHFSVKIQGASVDPQRFIETTQRFLK